MKITVCLVFCLFWLTASVQAQETEAGSFIASPSPAVKKTFDKKMTLVSIVLMSSMSIDTKSSFDTRQRCLGGCREMTQGVGWFIDRGPLAAYPAGLAVDSGITYVSYRMKKSSNPLLRHTWFVPPVAIAVGHLLAARDNYRLSNGAIAGYK
ncbi:MAG: hypothetical protein A2941_00775 [Candidatus Yanofskybacteria bacterium RIFCSPLOWO2_01_FULL_49_17]|uniref:DUF5683 domain-containing protein n=1 Tax=Candidatus Yanofskybacteria bacterium RIFCSPLOWO2_01_FULL_49_17 TaxID=1802700 RepID=A0A1F8GR19_9BACT|nr:MAG: hypothetical protein A2941_00775 [Candidatus Yanofskybacteria bacterium RIFCSPLOWO2_01_FULL_49_17]